MKSTLRRAQLVRDWREQRRLTTTELAAQITKAGGPKVRRQNVEQFEQGEIDRPRYLPELARVMGYGSVDQLIRCEPPPVDAEGQLSANAMALARNFDRIPAGHLQQIAYAMCEAAISQVMLQETAGVAPGRQPTDVPDRDHGTPSAPSHVERSTTYERATDPNLPRSK